MTATTEALHARLAAESAMQAGRGDHHLSRLLDDVADALAQQASVPSAEPAADLREKLIDAIAAGLGGTYHCTRVWSAWHVGTMSEDDFSPVDESDTPAELADAVLSIIGAAPLMANGLTEAETAGKWEGAEEWMPLAWELCADECGEDACTELVWEGGPVPEPWGDRWLKYEGEAKRLIALVRKHVPATAFETAATASVAGPQNRTLLQQYDREQLPGYHAGYEDGRLKGYEVGKRHAAPQAAPVAPDGRLHADGYFTWARRDGYVLDLKLPCDFWLIPPAPVAPTVQPLPARLVRFTLRDLKAERKRLDGFISLGNEIERAAEYDEWIAALEAYCTALGITAAPTKE